MSALTKLVSVMAPVGKERKRNRQPKNKMSFIGILIYNHPSANIFRPPNSWNNYRMTN